MNCGLSAADFESDLQIALQIALANESHDAFLFPRGLYDVVNELRNRNGAGNVLRQESSALVSLASLDVLCISIYVLWCVSYFHCCDFPFVFNFFDYIALSLNDSGHVSLPLLDFELNDCLAFLDCFKLFLNSVHRLICLSDFDLGSELCGTSLNLLHIESHDFFSCHY